MNATKKSPDVQLAFDVGHSSIGWAVLQSANGDTSVPPVSSINILGCGTVIFRADDCLASKRRGYRRQRRHIRSTRQRIARMKLLLKHLGVLSEDELNSVTTSSPWKLAASVLATNGKLVLTWNELWDVLRWYAHNRGYDANRRWSAAEVDTQEEQEDTEKLENAKSLLQKHAVTTMAETFCKELGVDPFGKKASSQVRFKGLNAAFPREVVEKEVRRILQAHFGRLKGVDTNLERALCGRDNSDRDAWQAIPCPEIKLPKRYEGGLLFGQLVPRFDNRIISKCPVTGEKVPSRNCREFLNFRWAMQLANVRVARNGERELRPLTADERKAVDAKMRAAGSMTAKEFTLAVLGATHATRSNLETMLMHPDAKDALLLDPVQKELTKGNWKTLFPKLPERIQKRARGQLRRGRALTLGKLYEQAKALGASVSAFDAELQRILDAANTKKSKKAARLTRESILNELASVKKLSGRAAYSRPILQKAYEEVMAGKDPKKEGGCLFVAEKMREAQLQREIDEQTNNCLVRHRLRLLERLQRDIIKEYAGGDKSRIGRITIEVNRDLREMSGKTAKEKAQDLRLRIADHHRVAEKLEKALKGQTFNGKPIRIGAGLIRKARIAEDLGWTCPYTGQKYEPIDLVTRRVDKDHIVPRSQRASDSLDSLVITFSAVNKWKGKRTALKFIEDEQGKTVPDAPNLSIVSVNRYREFVESLETYKGHNDDKKRKKRRKELMKLRDCEEGEFLPRDFTQTSQLVRLGAQMLKKPFIGDVKQPVIISMPGSVTGVVRKSLNLLGCLSEACPQVVDENGDVKTKSDIRDITHLHHALDACVLGLTSHFIPNNGAVWELIVKRNLTELEKEQLRVGTKEFFNYTREGFRVADLPKALKEQIRKRLAEKRVVQHIPARMSGLPTKETVWRIFDPKDTHPNSLRIAHWMSGKGVTVPQENDSTVLITRRKRKGKGTDDERGGKVFHETETWSWVYDEVEKTKVLGFEPISRKLRRIKGGKLIDDNFGLALYPEAAKGEPKFKPIRFFKVWKEIEKLPKTTSGKRPQILRRGQLVTIERGRYAGKVWRILGIEENGKIRFFSPDFTRRIDNPQNHERVMVTSLLRDGLKILKTPLTGVACPTTSSA